MKGKLLPAMKLKQGEYIEQRLYIGLEQIAKHLLVLYWYVTSSFSYNDSDEVFFSPIATARDVWFLSNSPAFGSKCFS